MQCVAEKHPVRYKAVKFRSFTRGITSLFLSGIKELMSFFSQTQGGYCAQSSSALLLSFSVTFCFYIVLFFLFYTILPPKKGPTIGSEDEGSIGWVCRVFYCCLSCALSLLPLISNVVRPHYSCDLSAIVPRDTCDVHT